MTAAWPGDVNMNALRDTYTETPERNVASFPVEVGPAKERQRTSYSTDLVTFTGSYTKAEWASLKTFYRTTLLDGTQPFIFTNPFDLTDGTYKFTAAPLLQTVRQLKAQVQIALRKMP